MRGAGNRGDNQHGCSQARGRGGIRQVGGGVGLGQEEGWLLQNQKEEQREAGCRCRCRFAVGC